MTRRSCRVGCSFSCCPWRSPPAAAPAARRGRPGDRRHHDAARRHRPQRRAGRQGHDAPAPNTDPHEYEVRPRRREGARVGRHRAALGRRGRRVARRRARRARAWTSRTSSTPAPRPASRATTRTGGRTRSAPRRPRPRSARRCVARACPRTRRPYVQRLQALDRGIARVHRPRSRRAQRALVTSHDALGYYARRYGMQVVGTVIPALSTAAQPSAGEVAKLVDDDQRTGREDDLRRELGQPEGRAGDRRARPARGSARSCGRTRSAPRAPTARPTSARSRPTRARWSRASAAARSTCRASMPDLSVPYIQRGIVEILLLAVLAGVLGTWVVLRRLPFYTHAIGTATFPGLVVAGPWGVPAQLTALVCAVGFGGVLERVQRTRRIDPDAAIGLLLVAALAIGVVLASDVYHSGAGVDRLLFGSLIALTPLDLWLTAAAAVAALLCDAALRRSWLATGFDPDGARAVGVRIAARRPRAAARGRGRRGRLARRRRRAAGDRRPDRPGRDRAPVRAAAAHAAARDVRARRGRGPRRDRASPTPSTSAPARRSPCSAPLVYGARRVVARALRTWCSGGRVSVARHHGTCAAATCAASTCSAASSSAVAAGRDRRRARAQRRRQDDALPRAAGRAAVPHGRGGARAAGPRTCRRPSARGSISRSPRTTSR